jgi:hypothetical protein
VLGEMVGRDILEDEKEYRARLRNATKVHQIRTSRLAKTTNSPSTPYEALTKSASPSLPSIVKTTRGIDEGQSYASRKKT